MIPQSPLRGKGKKVAPVPGGPKGGGPLLPAGCLRIQVSMGDTCTRNSLVPFLAEERRQYITFCFKTQPQFHVKNMIFAEKQKRAKIGAFSFVMPV